MIIRLQCHLPKNVNMAEAVAARREARRRKILENSNNRLQLIAGKTNNESPRASPFRQLNPEQNEDVPFTSDSSSSSKSTLNNGVLIADAEPVGFLSTRHEHDAVAVGDGSLLNDLAAFTASLPQIQPPAPETLPTPSIWEKITVHKYDIVLLSLIIQLLYGLSAVSFDNTYMFFPFAGYVVTKSIFFPVQSNSKIANALLLLNHLSRWPNGTQQMLHVTQWVGAIFQDISVYLFTTICVQSLFITLKDNFVT